PDVERRVQIVPYDRATTRQARRPATVARCCAGKRKEEKAVRFVCDSCQAKYSIADDRVENKVIKLNCQKCGHEITVRGPTTKAAAPEQRKAGAATMSQIQPIQRTQQQTPSFS